MLDKEKKRSLRMHTREFKADLVALVRAGRSVAQVAKDFRVASSLVYQWDWQSRVDEGKGPAGAVSQIKGYSKPCRKACFCLGGSRHGRYRKNFVLWVTVIHRHDSTLEDQQGGSAGCDMDHFCWADWIAQGSPARLSPGKSAQTPGSGNEFLEIGVLSGRTQRIEEPYPDCISLRQVI